MRMIIMEGTSDESVRWEEGINFDEMLFYHFEDCRDAKYGDESSLSLTVELRNEKTKLFKGENALSALS